MKIYLVRHGQTDWNYQKKIQGQQDVDINEQGIRQAEKLAEIFLTMNMRHWMIRKNWRRY